MVNTEGDTLKGFLKYKRYGEAAKQCVFSESTDGFRTYFPGEILGYGLKNELHFRSEIIEGISPRFFEVVFEGMHTLYSTRNKGGGTSFYIKNNQGEVQELRNKVQRIGGYLKKTDEFRDKLFIMLKADLPISEKIDETFLDRKSLIELMVFYEKQRGGKYTIWNKKIRTSTIVYALSSYNNSMLRLRTQESQVNYSGVSLGFGFSKELSRGSGRLWVSVEAQLGGKRYTDRIERAYVPGERINGFDDVLLANVTVAPLVPIPDFSISFDYDAVSLKLPVFLTWYIPAKGFSMGLSGGMSTIFDFGQKRIIVEEISSESFTYLRRDVDRIMPPVQIAYMGGVSFKLESKVPLEIGLMYIKGVRMAGAAGALLGVNTFQAIVQVPLISN